VVQFSSHDGEAATRAHNRSILLLTWCRHAIMPPKAGAFH
jgi:hypothetical protein